MNRKLSLIVMLVPLLALMASAQSKVYYTSEITPEALVKIYKALGVETTGRVAVKISTGEGGNNHYLKPTLIRNLVEEVNGTIVECCTAYGGSRQDVSKHWQTIHEHGFDSIFAVDIMDEYGQMRIPVKDRTHIKYDIVGDHLANYDWMINLAHFKGHAMGGYGGVLKNASIGVASTAGKAYIHTAGKTSDAGQLWQQIAEEWVKQTFDVCPDALISLMLRSREACVDYMMPLGLHHIFAFDHHYGPEPDGFKAEYPLEWCPVYYHRADSVGIGFDRTVATGTGATAQYNEPFRSRVEDLTTCPDEFLLWFHHVPWTYRLANGRTVLDELDFRYARGVAEVEDFISIWQQLRPDIDAQRWQEVDDKLHQQLDNAREWQNVCTTYFHSFTAQ